MVPRPRTLGHGRKRSCVGKCLGPGLVNHSIGIHYRAKKRAQIRSKKGHTCKTTISAGLCCSYLHTATQLCVLVVGRYVGWTCANKTTLGTCTPLSSPEDNCPRKMAFPDNASFPGQALFTILQHFLYRISHQNSLRVVDWEWPQFDPPWTHATAENWDPGCSPRA